MIFACTRHSAPLDWLMWAIFYSRETCAWKMHCCSEIFSDAKPWPWRRRLRHKYDSVTGAEASFGAKQGGGVCLKLNNTDMNSDEWTERLDMICGWDEKLMRFEFDGWDWNMIDIISGKSGSNLWRKKNFKKKNGYPCKFWIFDRKKEYCEILPFSTSPERCNNKRISP